LIAGQSQGSDRPELDRPAHVTRLFRRYSLIVNGCLQIPRQPIRLSTRFRSWALSNIPTMTIRFWPCYDRGHRSSATDFLPASITPGLISANMRNRRKVPGKQIERCVISTFQIAESMGFKGEFRQWEDLLRLGNIGSLFRLSYNFLQGSSRCSSPWCCASIAHKASTNGS